jgi:hypothetical protein
MVVFGPAALDSNLAEDGAKVIVAGAIDEGFAEALQAETVGASTVPVLQVGAHHRVVHEREPPRGRKP